MGQVFIMSTKDILFSKLLPIVNVPVPLFIYEHTSEVIKKPPLN